MKTFIINTIKLTLLVVALLYVCDIVYTQIYKRANPRNKLQYILKTENQTFDIVFLGSSRVANHVNTKLYDSLSNKKTINMGVLGAGLNDNLLQLKLLANKNKISEVFLQLDDNYQRIGPTSLGTASAMPFIKNKIIGEHLSTYFDNFNYLAHVPFYRYAVNDPKIGFREAFFSLINKEPKIKPSSGFTPKYGNNLSTYVSLPKTIAENNSILEEIRLLCKEKKIKLTFFVSPYSSKINNKDYIVKLKTKVPDLIDLSSGFEDSLFFNSGHLNNKGAELFTKKF